MMSAPDANPPASSSGAPSDPGMSAVVRRNIQSLMNVRREEERRRTFSDRIAGAVSAFAGSMTFVYVHAACFGAWLMINGGWIGGVPKWDPYPFVMLAMIASVEAIFLSTFILITQNRMQKLADRRAELDLQVSLLAEHELTQALKLLDGLAERLDVPRPDRHEMDDAKRDVNPETVAKEIAREETRLTGA
jgi:uncharacterized membrane protein